MIIAKGREIPTIELLYICDESFKKDVEKIRKRFSIKTVNDGEEEIVPIEDVMTFDHKMIKFDELRNKYVTHVKNLMYKYDLLGLDEDLQLFIESGETSYQIGKHTLRKPNKFAHVTVKPASIKWFEGKNTVHIAGVEVSFIVKRKINKSDLESWIDKHADQITTEANDYLADYAVGITKLTKAERIVEVIKLKEKHPKYTWEKIADIIAMRHPNDPDSEQGIINAKSCMMMYNRYKKRFDKK